MRRNARQRRPRPRFAPHAVAADSLHARSMATVGPVLAIRSPLLPHGHCGQSRPSPLIHAGRRCGILRRFARRLADTGFNFDARQRGVPRNTCDDGARAGSNIAHGESAQGSPAVAICQDFTGNHSSLPRCHPSGSGLECRHSRVFGLVAEV